MLGIILFIAGLEIILFFALVILCLLVMRVDQRNNKNLKIIHDNVDQIVRYVYNSDNTGKIIDEESKIKTESHPAENFPSCEIQNTKIP